MLDMLFGKFDTLLQLPEFKGVIYKLDTIGDAYIVVANLGGNCDADHADVVLRFASAMLLCTESVIMYQARRSSPSDLTVSDWAAAAERMRLLSSLLMSA